MVWPDNPTLDQERWDIPLNSNLTALKDASDDNADDIAALDTRLDTAESTITSQGTRITTLESVSRKVIGNTLKATLEEGAVSLAVQVVGDSTGNDTTEWVHLLATDVAADYPAYEVRHYIWDGSGQVIPKIPTVVQASPTTDRRCTWAGTGASRQYERAALTGDIDVRVKCQMSNWNDSVSSFIVGHFGNSGSRGWRLYKAANGYLVFDWTTDGTTLQTAVNSGTWSMPSTAIWIRVTLDVDNGASGHAIKFYTSTDGSTYTQFGSTTTRAGTTSVYNVTGHPMEIGCRASTVDPFSGSIYEVHVLSGLDGYMVAPALPEHWRGTGTTSPEPTGSPILTFVNGSHTGADLAFLDGGVVLENMTPDYGQIVVFVSDGHNEVNKHGPAFYSTMSTYLTSIRARLTAVPIIGLTQNPKISPATMTQAQAARRVNYMAWEYALGWTVIDTYGAFLDDGRALSDLVSSSDGIHPTSAGSVVWKNAVKAALGLA